MNAKGLLALIAQTFARHRFEAILIGNAAAALRGAPVTTLDMDFMFRISERNLAKIRAIAKDLGAVIMRPYYPASKLFRMMRDSDQLQIDLMPQIHGVSSFASLRSRATKVTFGGAKLWVAALDDIIRSKECAGRERDLAVLPVLRTTLDQTKQKKKSRPRASGAKKRK